MDASVMESTTMAARKTSAKKLTKSAFIRQQPPEKSVADVIAAGKEAGLSFTSSLVYMVRGRQDGKAAPKKTATKKSASKKSGAKKTSSKRASAAPKTPKTSAASKTTAPKKTGESKADFVRARAHLSPKEIVEDAKAHGLKLDPSYVYNVRGYDKATASKKTRASKKGASTVKTAPTPKKVASTSKPPVASNGSRPSGSSVEDLLRAAASELGLARAFEILEGERARVRAVMGGM